MREVQATGVEERAAEEPWSEGELVADDEAHVVVVSEQAGGGQCALLDEVVVGGVAVG